MISPIGRYSMHRLAVGEEWRRNLLSEDMDRHNSESDEEYLDRFTPPSSPPASYRSASSSPEFQLRPMARHRPIASPPRRYSRHDASSPASPDPEVISLGAYSNASTPLSCRSVSTDVPASSILSEEDKPREEKKVAVEPTRWAC
ncbi:hypothetical protein QR680_011517 [Steinernema hermaphroditum]|uniref:Uncharacterized protein n=1 Tax=Steinernema hermaphroditum TaxID=289476 RepID=A0AA39HYR7_9BILA|nr:hypothetical protein QR680_011517 [Steinernema hermaphroditum]